MQFDGWVLVMLFTLGIPRPAEAQDPAPPAPPPPAAQDSSAGPGAPSSWEVTAEALAAHPGSRYNFWCPPGGRASPVWGDQIYTSDSSVCTAAVHAGNLSLLSGGNAIIEMRPGQSSYAAARRNGIATSSRGAWKASFVLVNPS